MTCFMYCKKKVATIVFLIDFHDIVIVGILDLNNSFNTNFFKIDHLGLKY